MARWEMSMKRLEEDDDVEETLKEKLTIYSRHKEFVVVITVKD